METTITAILSAKVDAFLSGINQATSKLQNFGQDANRVGSVLTKNITLPLGILGTASLKAAGDLEALKKGLTSVMGSSSAAEKELAKLKEVAKLPGLGFEEAVSGSVNLQAAGFSADIARRSLMGFGNALATVGKGKAELDGISHALTTLATSPKVLQEELNEIRERLPQFQQLMINAFGTARSEDIQKMGISGKAFVEKMLIQLEKLPKASGGLKNAFENASDAIQSSLAKLGESINKNFDVEGKLNKLSDLITEVADKFSKLTPETQKFVLMAGGIAAALGPVALAIGGVISALKPLGAGFAAIASPVSVAILAIGGMIYYWDAMNAIIDKTIAKLYQVKGAVLTAMGFSSAGADAFQRGGMWWNEGKSHDAAIVAPQIKAREDAKRQEMLARNAARRDARFNTTGADDKKGAAPFDPDADKKLKAYVDAQSEASKNIIDSLQRVRDISISLITDETEQKREQLKAQAADRRVQANTEVLDEGQRAREILSINEKLVADLKALDEIKPLKSTAQGVSTFQAFKDAGFNTNSNKGDLQKDVLGKTAELPGGKSFVKALEDIAEKIKAPLTDMEERFKDLTKSIEQSLKDAALAGLTGIGELVGGLMSGAKDLASLPQLFGSVLAGLAKQIGQSMIKFGIAGIAIKRLAINPYLAIAAGAGLIALGSALSASVQKSTGSIKLARGGLAYGPTLATVGDNTNARYDPEVISPLSKLREYMGGGSGNIEVNGRLSNDVIRLSNARGQQTRNTLRGK